jgi:hypothetical protein
MEHNLGEAEKRAVFEGEFLERGPPRNSEHQIPNTNQTSIFPRVFVFMLLTVPPCVDDDDHEDYEADTQENNHPGPTFPNLLYATRKLGPIHVIGQYTFTGKK